MLTYTEVLYRYTLPAISVLTLLAHPFVGRSEIFKIVLIITFAVIYTAPWNNYIVYNEALIYAPQRINNVIKGYVPVEEYVFLVVHTVITALWTLLCVQWSTPCLSFNCDRRSYLLIRWTPILLLGAATVTGYATAIPGRETFYVGCILCWACPAIMFLWYGAGNFFVKKIVSSSVAIAVPTVYACCVDRVARKNHVWHVNESNSLNVFVAENLPLERALFFVVTSFLVVLAANAYDKSRGMTDTFTSDFPRRFGFNGKSFFQLVRAFFTSEYSMSSAVIDDIKTCIKIIDVGSKTFVVSRYFVQASIQLDMMILYAFCRVSDDTIDDATDAVKIKRKYRAIKWFVDELFANRRSDLDVWTRPRDVSIDWARYQDDLTDIQLAAYRAISRISFYMPRRPFDGLLAGYRWDIEDRTIENENDLRTYAGYVAGNIGELIGYVLMYRSDDAEYDVVGRYDVIEKAQTLGQALQYINIARDIVIDSETLGRCYLPTDYLDDKDKELKILCIDKNPRLLGNKKLMKYASKMIKLANDHQADLENAIKCLSYDLRRSIFTLLETYLTLRYTIMQSPTYPNRAFLTKWDKICIGLYTMYFKSNQYI